MPRDSHVDRTLRQGPTLLVGSVEVALGETTATASVDELYNGKHVFLTFVDIDANVIDAKASVASGTLTVTVDAATAAATEISYLIYGN